MTLTEYLDAIAEKLGVTNLPDRLLTTYLEAFAKKDGVNVSALPDRLASTYLNAILKAKGVQPVKNNLLTTQLAALAGAYGATDLTDSLVSTYLNAIIGGNSGFNGVGIEVLLEETSLASEFAFLNISEYMGDQSIAKNETCVVTIDGTSYRCETWKNPSDAAITYIGDSRLLGDDYVDNIAGYHVENVPFAIENFYEGNSLWGDTSVNEWYIYFADSNTHTVKIEREFEIPKTEFVITGNETFNFQAADNTVYYKNSNFVNVLHEDIVHAECTHFKWDDGAVIADLDDGCFLFNYTKTTGIGTGNISFKRTDLFTSSSAAKEWFKGQVANGTPVTVTVYVKG